MRLYFDSSELVAYLQWARSNTAAGALGGVGTSRPGDSHDRFCPSGRLHLTPYAPCRLD